MNTFFVFCVFVYLLIHHIHHTIFVFIFYSVVHRHSNSHHGGIEPLKTPFTVWTQKREECSFSTCTFCIHLFTVKIAFLQFFHLNYLWISSVFSKPRELLKGHLYSYDYTSPTGLRNASIPIFFIFVCCCACTKRGWRFSNALQRQHILPPLSVNGTKRPY